MQPGLTFLLRTQEKVVVNNTFRNALQV